MKDIGRVLGALDEILAPENKIHSTVKEVSRYYDPKTAEHAYTLEYRVKVAPANRPYRSRRAGSLLGAILGPGEFSPTQPLTSGTSGSEDQAMGMAGTQP